MSNAESRGAVSITEPTLKAGEDVLLKFRCCDPGVFLVGNIRTWSAPHRTAYPYRVIRVASGIYFVEDVCEGFSAGDLIEFSFARSECWGTRFCIVASPTECTYVESDGSVVESNSPPTGGIVIDEVLEGTIDSLGNYSKLPQPRPPMGWKGIAAGNRGVSCSDSEIPEQADDDSLWFRAVLPITLRVPPPEANSWNCVQEAVDYIALLIGLATAQSNHKYGTFCDASRKTVAADQDAPYREVMERMRESFRSEYGFGSPVELDPLAPLPYEAALLARWNYFNPFGPSQCYLSLERPQNEDFLLVFGTDHPFYPQKVALGIIPYEDAKFRPRLLRVLRDLFATNGSPGYLIMDSLFSSIPIDGEQLLTLDELKELFWLIASRLPGLELEQRLRFLAEIQGEQWLGPRREYETGLAKAFALSKYGIEESEHLLPTRFQFDQWWERVADPEHVAADEINIHRAWAGSQLNFLGAFKKME